MNTIKFLVTGKPAPGGSKKAFAFRGKDGRLHSRVVEDCKRNAGWRELVTAAAASVMAGSPPMHGAISVVVTFHMPRPKDHFRSNGELKPGAPRFHTKKPDATKLWRSTEDALSGIVWHDDSLIARQNIEKVYSDGAPGCSIEIAAIAE